METRYRPSRASGSFKTPNDSLSDEGLMERSARGDESAFTEIVRRYAAPLVAFAHRATGERDIAEDLAQEVFLRLFVNARRYRPGRPLRTWIFSIARNLCRDRIRARGARARESVLAGEPSARHPRHEAEREELLHETRAAVEALPETHREIVLLHVMAGLSHAESARLLGLPHGTVRRRFHEAVERLREVLEPG